MTVPLRSLLGGCLLTAAGLPLVAVDLDADTAVRLEMGVTTEIRFINGQAVHYALDGFLLEHGERRLVGRAIRLASDDRQIFATGSLVLTQPGLRLAADRLSADLAMGSGQAWNVVIRIPHPGGAIRLRAKRITFDRERIVCHGISTDSGHGGLMRLGGTRLVIGLRAEEATHRLGPARHLTHIAFWHPVARLGPLPVLYSPVIYRDFRLDYPWTRYEVGTSSRLGPWIRAWTRIDFGHGPWSHRILARADWYDRVGLALGIRPQWKLGPAGTGELLWYGFDEEKIRLSSDAPIHERRYADSIDARHHLPFPGGALAFRHVELPPADRDMDPNERFRNDYLEDELEHQTLARSGVQVAWSSPWVGTAALIDLPPVDREGLKREPELRLTVPDLQLIGPLHLSGAGSVGRLIDDDDEARRSRFRTGIGMAHWFRSGIGLDGQVDLDGIGYHDTSLAGTEIDAADRIAVGLEAGIRLRLLGTFGRTRHVLAPRVGIDIAGKGQGDDLPAYSFDPIDSAWEEDHRYLTTGLETSVTHGQGLFSAEIEARWALRDEDALKEEVGDIGDRLIDVTFDLEGKPIPALSLSGRGLWDGAGETRGWSTFSLTAEVGIGNRVLAGGTATWRNNDIAWQYRPELSILGNRYRLDTYLVYELDHMISSAQRTKEAGIEATRRMVDGQLSLEYRFVRNDDDEDDPYDHRFTVGFSWQPFMTP